MNYKTIFQAQSKVVKISQRLGAKHVVLLAEGMSSEREVSKNSAASVSKALQENGYSVTMVDPGADLGAVLVDIKPDLVYNALHGTYGEDGSVSGLLNMMHIPYTHSGLKASCIGFSKLLTRKFFASDNMVSFTNAILVNKNEQLKQDPMPRPFVIKPLAEGSSVGIKVVFSQDDFNFADYVFEYGEQILVEEYIKGREIQVAVLNGKALGALEIKVLKNRFYDYQTKYTAGYAQHIMPAPLSKQANDYVMAVSEHIYKSLGCNGIARAEFLYDEQTKRFYFLEINTHPGMTSLSICPEIAAFAGISFNDMIEMIIASAKYE